MDKKNIFRIEIFKCNLRIIFLPLETPDRTAAHLMMIISARRFVFGLNELRISFLGPLLTDNSHILGEKHNHTCSREIRGKRYNINIEIIWFKWGPPDSAITNYSVEKKIETGWSWTIGVNFFRYCYSCVSFTNSATKMAARNQMFGMKQLTWWTEKYG